MHLGDGGRPVEAALAAAREDPYHCFVSTVESIGSGGIRSGPLGGVPFAAKDNLDTVTLPTTANTPGLLSSRPAAENPAIDALTRAGAVLIGKTNMHELALGITTNDAAFPATRNPADPERSAGGSSGGSAAAVAAGIVPFALGTDTGGSLTIPAAWCGVFGFRPSTGRWPGGGVIPLSPTRDTVGVIADSLELIAAVDAAVCGEPAGEVLGDAADRVLRVGIPLDGSEFLSELDTDVRSAWEHWLARLADDPGVELVRVDTSGLHDLERGVGSEIEFFEISYALERYLGGLLVPMRFPELRERVAREDVGALLDESWRARGRGEQYRVALASRGRLQDRYREVFASSGLDTIAYPSVPITATKLDGEPHDVFAVGTRNVNPASVSGQPVVSVPFGCGLGTLPVGISLEGARFGDRALLGTVAELAACLAP